MYEAVLAGSRMQVMPTFAQRLRSRECHARAFDHRETKGRRRAVVAVARKIAVVFHRVPPGIGSRSMT